MPASLLISSVTGIYAQLRGIRYFYHPFTYLVLSMPKSYRKAPPTANAYSPGGIGLTVLIRQDFNLFPPVEFCISSSTTGTMSSLRKPDETPVTPARDISISRLSDLALSLTSVT